jgi:outer membrane protein TolC
MYRKFFLILLFIFPFKTFAQDSLLTIQQAIEIALKNNYDIKIASNSNKQQENNNTAGNAGMLPVIEARGSYTHSSNSLKQKYNNGTEVNKDASNATATVGDVGATWTVFDGLKMFYTKEKLSQLSFASQDQFKMQVESSLQELIASYYTIVRQEQLLKSMREEIKLSEERNKIAERKMTNGSGSRLEWLQAKTEYNRQKALELQLESEAEAARIKLNRLLGRNIETSFRTEDTVIITYKPMYDQLKRTVVEQNNRLNYFRRNQHIANLELRENQSLRLPVIAVNAHYTYTKNTSEAGFNLLNQAQGFNYGATAIIPLFHGFNISRQIKNSKLDLMNADLSLESATASINEELYNAWRDFSNNLELLQMEEQNILYAREILTVSQERFRVGSSNAVELQESRRTFEDAMTRLVDARYQAKISETTLKRLNGELVK